MKITPELLEKFANGSCSKEEKKFVEQWLNMGLDVESEKNARLFKPRHEKVWNRVKTNILQNQTKVISLKRNFLQISAAACIAILVLSSIAYTIFVSTSVDEKYSAIKDTEGSIVLSGMDLKVFKGSEVLADYNHETEFLSLSLEGEVELTNNAGCDIEMEVNYPSNGNLKKLEKVRLQNGYTYLICRFDKHKFDEILVLDVNKTGGLSPFLVQKIVEASQSAGFDTNHIPANCSTFQITNGLLKI